MIRAMSYLIGLFGINNKKGLYIMKYIRILALAALLGFTAMPQISSAQTTGGSVYVDVNGLVCDFCARALEKVFGKEEAVDNIDVNLDSKVVTINFKDDQSLDNETITTMIQDAGYHVVGIREHEKSQDPTEKSEDGE